MFTFGKKVKIEIGDMDYKSWRDSLVKDCDVLELLTLMVGDITPEYDSKLQELFRVIKDKLEHPINVRKSLSLRLLRIQQVTYTTM